MLRNHQTQRVCHSCHVQLLSLFEYGFTRPIPRVIQRRWTPPRTPRIQFSRLFSVSARLGNQGNQVDHESEQIQPAKPDPITEDEKPITESIEEVVIKARQTFGETLPKDFLSEEEYKLYERLYGPPVRETQGGDLEVLGEDGEEDIAVDQGGRNVVMKENEDGVFEDIELEVAEEEAYVEEVQNDLKATTLDPHTVSVQAHNQREVDAILRLQKDMELASAQLVDQKEEESMEEENRDLEEAEEEELPEEEEEDAAFSGDYIRTHPHTMAGRWGTSPATLNLPTETFVSPITELLSRASHKHLTEAAEKAFGGVGLPYSTSTPSSLKHLPQKHIGLDAGQHRMSEIEADAFIAAVMPGAYAAVTSTLVEVRKRVGKDWLRNLILRDGGPRILDAGAGGAGLLAWREIAQTEWDLLAGDLDTSKRSREPPSGLSAVLTGPAALKDRVSQLLENTTFLPRLPDYIHSANSEKLLDGAPAQGRKSFDIIIAAHTLLPLKEDYRRKSQIQNLWSMLSSEGGILILIEKGLPRGFEAIAGARALILDNYISSPSSTHKASPTESAETAVFIEKEKGMIVAPCTNHVTCPMYRTPGLSSGRKDFCHFEQRFTRPPFLQHLLNAKMRNHEDVKFSYLAVRRGIDSRDSSQHSSGILQGEAATEKAFEGYETPFDPQDSRNETPGKESWIDENFSPLSLPRAILPPLKRRGHVTLDLCTPAGTIERWTVPKSFSTQAYRDARKSKHGDLWALGAKTRLSRNIKLGRPVADREDDDEKGSKNQKSWKKGKMGTAGKLKKKETYEILMGDKGMEGIREVKKGRVDYERRTKKGRVMRPDRKHKEMMKELNGRSDDDEKEEF